MSLKRNPYLLSLLAAFFFSLMNACVKVASPRIPVMESVFFRSAISAFVLGLFLLQRRVSFVPGNTKLLFVRSLAGTIAIYCTFYAVSNLTLGDTAILIHTAPLFAVLLSVIVLGERPVRTVWWLVVVAWLGIALILRPQFGVFNFAGVVAVMAGLFAAISAIVIRQSSESDHPLRIAFYFMLFCALVTIPFAARGFVAPRGRDIAALIGAGVFGTFGQIAFTTSFALEEVSRVSPLTYSGVVFAFVLGILFWGEVPSPWSLTGSAIVIASCIKIVRLEKTLVMAESPGGRHK